METETTPRNRSSMLPMDVFHRTKVIFMACAFAALVLSVTLWFTGNEEEGVFVGLWVPAIHSLGTLVLVGERPQPIVVETGGRSS